MFRRAAGFNRVSSGLSVVTTWTYDKLKMGELKLLPERFHNKNRDLDLEVLATCVCITHCGNFVVIGYSTGHVDRFTCRRFSVMKVLLISLLQVQYSVRFMALHVWKNKGSLFVGSGGCYGLSE